MFEHALLRNEDKAGKRRSVMLAFLGQAVGLTALALASLAYTERLPQVHLMHVFAPAPLAPEPPLPRVPARSTVSSAVTVPTPVRALQMPARVPQAVDMVPDAPSLAPADSHMMTGVMHGGGIFSSLGDRTLPPPPPPPLVKSAAPPKPTQPLRIGGSVLQAALVRKVTPLYPPLAKQARISGTVTLLGVIGKDGRVQNLQVLNGHPLLVQAALEAVRQWLYRPTLLNGEPVEVSAPIEVRFLLN